MLVLPNKKTFDKIEAIILSILQMVPPIAHGTIYNPLAACEYVKIEITFTTNYILVGDMLNSKLDWPPHLMNTPQLDQM